MTPPEAEGAAGRGERKLVTTLFADLSGFTALSEALDPEEVRELVNDCFDVLVPVVEACGGTVDKFIGDELMALFGAPVAHEDDAARCLTAALRMMERFGSFAAERTSTLGLHIGIETGTVVTGGLGSRGREEYSVVGDAVNLAARLADAAEAGDVLVGPATRRLAGPAFTFAELGHLALKGKAAPVPVGRLEGVEADVASQRRPRVAAPLVGRDVELARLITAVSRLAHGEGGAIAVVGEPGVGKSRLLAEARSASPAGVRWAEGKGRAFGQTSTYTVAQQLLTDLTEPGLGPPGNALRAAIGSALPDPSAFAAVYPYLARLQGMPLTPEEDECVRYLEPEALRARIRGAFAAFVRALSAAGPLVLVWEDLHWADPSSLDLAEALLPLAAECPVQLVFVSRPHEGDADAWIRRAAAEAAVGVRILTLAPLDEGASELLVDGLLPVRDLPEQAKRLILDKADGNPFFLEELLRSLLDSGLVVVRDGAAVATEGMAELSVPDTLQGVAAARIDALVPTDKETLQCAAVLGRAFETPVLKGLCQRVEPGSELGVPPSLRELCRRELVRERTDVDYVFKHVVTRDVAYNGLLLSRRRALHRHAAEVVAAMFPDRLDQLAATLAHHWRAAGEHERALSCLLSAARQARATFSNAEARQLYEEALEEVGDDDDARVLVHENLGDLLLLAGDPAAARTHFQAALESAAGEGMRIARLERKAGNTWVPSYKAAEAAAAYDRAGEALGPRPAGEAPAWWAEWVELLVARIWLGYWMGDEATMDALTGQAREALEPLAGSPERLKLLFALPLLDLHRSRYHPSEQSLALVEELFIAAQESGDVGDIARATSISAFTHLWRDDLEQALSRFEYALELSRRIGDVTWEVRALVYLGVAHRAMGHDAEVVGLSERILALAAGMPEYLGSAHGHLAWALLRAGDAEKAAAHAETAWRYLEQAPADPFRWIVAWPLLCLRLDSIDVRGAVELAASMLGHDQLKLPDELEAPLEAAVCAAAAGDEILAADLLRGAVAAAKSAGGRWL